MLSFLSTRKLPQGVSFAPGFPNSGHSTPELPAVYSLTHVCRFSGALLLRTASTDRSAVTSRILQAVILLLVLIFVGATSTLAEPKNKFEQQRVKENFTSQSAQQELTDPTMASEGSAQGQSESATKPLKSLEFQGGAGGNALKSLDLSSLAPLRLDIPRGPALLLESLGQRDGRVVLGWKNGQIALVDGAKPQARLVTTVAKDLDLLALHSDDGLLAAVNIDTVILYQLPEGRELLRRDFKTRIQSVVFSPDGSSVLIGGADGRIYRWQYRLQQSAGFRERGRIVERYVGNASTVAALFYLPTGKVFFSGSWDGTLAGWQEYSADDYEGQYDEDLIAGELFTAKATRQTAKGQGRIEHIVAAAQFDGKLWLSRDSGMIERWSVRGLTKRSSAQLHRGMVHALAVTADGSLAASVGRDGVVRVYRPGRAEEIVDVRAGEILNVERESRIEGAAALCFWGNDELIVAQRTGAVQFLRLANMSVPVVNSSAQERVIND